MPPNPFKPIQQAATHVDSAAREVIDRVLAMTTIDESALELHRSVSSIDDLTAHLEVVTERVERIDRNMEQLLPLLERLVVSSEALQQDLAPISRLASRIPGSGARRRRRERQQALAIQTQETAAPTALPAGDDVPDEEARAADAATDAPPRTIASPDAEAASGTPADPAGDGGPEDERTTPA